MNHNGKKAVITGGTRGIGRAIALRLASEGCDLALNYLSNEESANETLEAIRKASPSAKVHLMKANLADPEETRKMADEAIGLFGHIDYLVHSAALGNFKPVSKLRMNQWDLSFDINVKSFLILCQKLTPAMGTGSSVLALSSSGSKRVVPNYGAVGITKAALEALVRYLAAEYIRSGIRVNAISAGLIETRSLEAFPEFDRMKKEIVSRTPAGRIGNPEDLVGLASFLLSEDAGWIVGQTVVADGGLSLI